jgi:hypothetical protein
VSNRLPDSRVTALQRFRSVLRARTARSGFTTLIRPLLSGPTPADNRSSRRQPNSSDNKTIADAPCTVHARTHARTHRHTGARTVRGGRSKQTHFTLYKLLQSLHLRDGRSATHDVAFAARWDGPSAGGGYPAGPME